MNQQTSPTITSLEQNKREMFDGMRAYHQSEINHANHAITMLLAISAAAGAVVLAILFPQDPPSNIQQVVWGLWGVVLLFSITIALTAHIKIDSDHAVYASFGKEYVKTSELLGFYSIDITANSEIGLKTNRAIGQGTGYRKTQIIVWAFAVVLNVLTLLFALFICSLL